MNLQEAAQRCLDFINGVDSDEPIMAAVAKLMVAKKTLAAAGHSVTDTTLLESLANAEKGGR